MKDLVVISRDITFGGGGVYTQKLIHELLKHGFKITLIAPENSFGNNVIYIKENILGKTFITRELFFFFSAYRTIKKHNLEKKIILLQHNIYLKGINNVFAFRHASHKGHLQALKFKKGQLLHRVLGIIFHSFYAVLDNYTLTSSKKNIFISKKTLDNSIKRLPKIRSKSIYIPNFIDIEDNKKNTLISENKKNIFLFIGRLEPLKGIDNLCKILKENQKNLKKEIGDFELHIAGDGCLKNKIIKYDFTRYHGKLNKDEIVKLYKKSDIFIFPSLYENCPTVILEAMQYGNLILSRKVGDVPYMLSTEEIYENNEEIFMKLINLLQGNKITPLRKQHIKKLNFFSTQKNINKIIKLLGMTK